MNIAFEDAESGVIGQFDSVKKTDGSNAATEIVQLAAADPSNMKMRTLSANQTIVGIYGVKDESNHFTSFGFLLKEKNLQ